MNPGIGDADRFLDGGQVGVTVTGFDEASLGAALRALDALYAAGGDAVAARCRALAERDFALPIGVGRYDAAYREAARA